MSDEMWAYVDESGCMGMKLDAGSSLFFTVVTVIFSDKTTVTRCSNRIEELKLSLKPGKEFSFHGSSHDQRIGFLHAMREFDFKYFGIVFDKAQIGGFSRPFLHLAVMATFAQHADKIKNAKVVFDRTGSNEFRKMMCKKMKGDLNRECGRDVISSVKDVESHCNNLVQLADMVCGAVARSFHPEKGVKHDFRGMLRSKEWLIAIHPSRIKKPVCLSLSGTHAHGDSSANGSI